MSEQESIGLTPDGDATEGNFQLADGSVILTAQYPPPDRLILRDETGQPWTITVGIDGSILSARHSGS